MNETPFMRRLIVGFYAMLLAGGLIFYWTWSLLYDTWTDIGVYSLSAVLIGFGAVGLALYSIKPLEQEED